MKAVDVRMCLCIASHAHMLEQYFTFDMGADCGVGAWNERYLHPHCNGTPHCLCVDGGLAIVSLASHYQLTLVRKGIN